MRPSLTLYLQLPRTMFFFQKEMTQLKEEQKKQRESGKEDQVSLTLRHRQLAFFDMEYP